MKYYSWKARIIYLLLATPNNFLYWPNQYQATLSYALTELIWLSTNRSRV